MNFKDILAERSVFVNRDALSPHFLPERILHRDKEIEKIMRALVPVFKGRKPRNIFIYGKTGTGKTSSVKHVMRQFAEIPSNGTINYTNCRMHNTRYKILQKLSADTVGFSKSGFPPSVFYDKLLDWIEAGKRSLILVLDEVDMVKDLNDLVYTLTRANDDLKDGDISIVGISNRISFKSQLDPRSKSSLLETELVFPPYNSDQLKGILEHRAEIGFRDDSYDISAVNLAAAVAARETGDARYALKLLMYAGEIADEQKDKIVTFKNVETARKQVEEDIVVDAVSTLPEHQQLVLLALASLNLTGSKYHKLGEGSEDMFTSGEFYETYMEVCNKLKRESRSSRWCKEYLRELEALGLVHQSESGKGLRGHSTLIKLAYPAEKIKRVVQGMLV